jgi:hypothetical protein
MSKMKALYSRTFDSVFVNEFIIIAPLVAEIVSPAVIVSI